MLESLVALLASTGAGGVAEVGVGALLSVENGVALLH